MPAHSVPLSPVHTGDYRLGIVAEVASVDGALDVPVASAVIPVIKWKRQLTYTY